jgi:hypothetical protein
VEPTIVVQLEAVMVQNIDGRNGKKLCSQPERALLAETDG